MYSVNERNEVLQRLDSARDGLQAALTGMSEAQSSFKPLPDAWSVAEIVEHLAIVEGFVIMRIQEMASAPNDGNFRESDAVLAGRITDRTDKFKAPERAHPTGKPLANSLERLVASREKIAGLVQAAPAENFREHSTPHPVFGPLDGHQWLVALAAHCVRHTKQINETKSTAAFPRA